MGRVDRCGLEGAIELAQDDKGPHVPQLARKVEAVRHGGCAQLAAQTDAGDLDLVMAEYPPAARIQPGGHPPAIVCKRLDECLCVQGLEFAKNSADAGGDGFVAVGLLASLRQEDVMPRAHAGAQVGRRRQPEQMTIGDVRHGAAQVHARHLDGQPGESRGDHRAADMIAGRVAVSKGDPRHTRVGKAKIAKGLAEYVAPDVALQPHVLRHGKSDQHDVSAAIGRAGHCAHQIERAARAKPRNSAAHEFRQATCFTQPACLVILQRITEGGAQFSMD